MAQSSSRFGTKWQSPHIDEYKAKLLQEANVLHHHLYLPEVNIQDRIGHGVLNMLKYGFHKKYFQKNETLTS